MNRIHVIPVGGKEPLHHCNSGCWCFPSIDQKSGEEDASVWVHNAKDCREKYERQGLPQTGAPWILVIQ